MRKSVEFTSVNLARVLQCRDCASVTSVVANMS